MEKRNQILENSFAHNRIDELSSDEKRDFWASYVEELLKIRIVDLSVGSGAFLVSCYEILKREINNASEMQKIRMAGLHRYSETWESDLLNDCLYGKDIMPDAISVAKLSLWISSIKKEHELTDFDNNFVVGDSLSVPINIRGF